MRGRKLRCIAAAPACLKQRIEKKKPLPDVHVSGHVNPLDEDDAKLIARVHHVTGGGLGEDLTTELLFLMTPRWAVPKAEEE
jgi:hypothetical protein